MKASTSAGARSYKFKRLAVSLLGFLVLFAPGIYLASKWFEGTLDLTKFAVEHSPLELLHNLLCALAATFFFLSWKNGKGPVRVAGGALAMLAAAAFVREVDLELITKALGRPWLVWIGEHGLQEIALIAMTLPILFYLSVNRRYTLGVLRLALRSEAWPLYVSGILVLLCIYLDERVVHDISTRFWEELIETYSYVFMSIAGWRHLQLLGDPTWDREDA